MPRVLFEHREQHREAARVDARGRPARHRRAGAASTSACTSTSIGPRALEHRGDRPSRARPARRSTRKQRRRVGHVDQARARSSRTARARRCRRTGASSACSSAQRVAAVAVEREHGVDDVLEHARPGERAVLGDVTDEHRGAARAPSRAARAGARTSRTWVTEPGAPGRSGSSDGLDRVDREHVGRDRRRRGRARAGSDVSATTSRSGCERAEPLGPQPHLRARLLGGDEQAACAAARPCARAPGAAACSCRCPGSPPSSVTEPAHEPAAEHPVELGDPGGHGRRDAGVDVADRHRTVGRDPGGATATAHDAARASTSVPHASHAGQRPSHRGDSPPHSEQRWTVSSSLDGTRTVRRGCDTQAHRRHRYVRAPGAASWSSGSIST